MRRRRRAGLPAVVVALGVTADEARARSAALVRMATVVEPLHTDLTELDDRYHDATWSAMVVMCSHLGDLRLAAPLFDSIGRAQRIVIDLERAPGHETSVGLRGWTQLADANVAMGPVGCGRYRYEVSAATPFDVRPVIAALTDQRPRKSSNGARISVADATALAWCVDEPDAQTAAVAARSGGGPPPDLTLVGEPASGTGVRSGTAKVVDVSKSCPPVDVRVVNPLGYLPRAGGPVATIQVAADGAHRHSPADVAALRSARHVELSDGAASGLAVAAVLAQLAVAGVPLVTGRLAADVAAHLHPELVEAIESATPDATSNAVRREAISVRQRRAALRRHDTRAAWSLLRSDLGWPEPPRLTTSVLVATSRPALLAHALHSVAQQRDVDLELVLVTHGFSPTDEQLRPARECCDYPLTVLTADAALPLGSVLNIALAAASGDVVTKMDDDDWYGPHHVEDLQQALYWSGATVAGARSQFTYLCDLDITVQRQYPAACTPSATRAPGPTMTMRREDLRSLGGFRPVPRLVDFALNETAQRLGATIALAHGLGYLRCRHGLGHTWVANTSSFLRGLGDQQRGFCTPPEVVDDTEARAHLAAVRQQRKTRTHADLSPVAVALSSSA